MATLFAYGVSAVWSRGAVFVEKIFGWHGMGEWVVQGSQRRTPTSSSGHHGVLGAVVLPRGVAIRRHLRGARSASAGDVSESVSRRTLVLRRFRRNRSAVAALVVLVALFIGCYALPPLLPYLLRNWTTPPTTPSSQHWFGTTAISQDLLVQILRGMQKSMLIGVCVAAISTTIAATVGSFAGFFGGWRDRALMWVVDLLPKWCRASS